MSAGDIHSVPAAAGRTPTRMAGARRTWIPGQHGAWAMLAVPLLLGVAAGRPDLLQIVLALAAVTGYLGTATAQVWLRSGRRRPYLAPPVTWLSIAGVLSLVLIVIAPPLAAAAVVVGPAGLLIARGARPGTRRDLVNSLAQVAIALVLVPAAALLSGQFAAGAVLRATAVAAGYLAGSVLVVRSLLRERGNRRFAAASVGFHAALVAGAAVLLPLPYAPVAVLLLLRAWALPIVQRRRAAGRRPLRPVHVGAVELVVAILVVAVAFLVPPTA